jgi:hypothetical protein
LTLKSETRACMAGVALRKPFIFLFGPCFDFCSPFAHPPTVRYSNLINLKPVVNGLWPVDLVVAAALFAHYLIYFVCLI